MENIFGENFLKDLIWDRVKTFEDAIKELGEGNPLVKDWIEFCDSKLKNRKDIEAYLKLRIIAAALNEGWEPKFMEDECRYYPHFVFYTKREIDKMDEEFRSYLVYRSYSDALDGGGVAYSMEFSDSSYTNAYAGSRILFKSEELAEYAGKQFLDIYADFIWR